jgi:PAS domain S-box-containing protein
VGSPVGPVLAGRSAWLRYAVALLIVGLVTAARYATNGVLGMQAPLLPFAIAIFAVAFVCGYGPALLASLLSAAIATAFFAIYPLADSLFAWVMHVATFLVLGVLVSVMMHRLQRAYRAQRDALNEARSAHQSSEDAQQALSLALRAGRSGTFDWDLVSNRSIWSEELLELHGFGRGGFAGTREAWEACVHPEDLERVVATFERAMGDDYVVLEYRIRRHDDGQVRWLHCCGRVSHDAERRPVRMIGINVDITEQKRAEEALRDVDRRKDEFLAMLAHELRNPLAPIRYVAHLLARENADLVTVRRNGEVLLRQVTHLARLVDDLLDAARISRGMIEIKKDTLWAEATLQRAMESMQSALGAKHQTLRYTPAPDPLPVLGDAVRLEQVFVNLLSNASKYSPELAPIHVSAEVREGHAVFRIRDEGTGIDPQTLTRVFDLFLQADQSLDRPHGGLGIGLTIVKRIVDLHGGSVEALSGGLGLGSEFVVRLPLAQAGPRVNRERGYEVVVRRVLVVEDNYDSAQMLRELLKSDGHLVAIAGDGADALRQLESFAPEWILMDIGLPGMDGYAVAGLMRQREAGRAAHIYALTGYGNPEDRALALKSGFEGHLTKPVDPENLLRLLSEGAPLRADSRSSRSARHH